jgi:sugar phosphate isomerase/epimerase
VLTRRQFTLSSVAAVLPLTTTAEAPAAGVLPAHRSTYRGVALGLITGSLNPLPVIPGRDPIDVIIAECLQLNADNVELVDVGGEVPPKVVNGGRFGQVPDVITPEYQRSREILRQWRIRRSLDRFREVRRKFDEARLNLFSYVWTVADDDSDEEIDAGFRQLRALGVQIFCTNQTRATVGPRLAPFAAKYRIHPAWHPHDQVDDPRAVASAASLEHLLALSPEFRVNLDIGHFTAGNQDAVAFLEKHHRRITHLHIKDRKRNHGPNVQLGTGDTPIKPCLDLVRNHRWPIYAILEREYRGGIGNAAEQTAWQLAYMKRVLDS